MQFNNFLAAYYADTGDGCNPRLNAQIAAWMPNAELVILLLQWGCIVAILVGMFFCTS